LGGVATAGTLTLMDKKPDQPIVQVQKGGVREPLVEEPKAPQAKTTETAKTAEPAEEVKEYEVTFKLDTNRVEVLVGNDIICQPTKSKECSTTLPEGDEKVTFTFKKRGYKETTMEVVPNSDQTIKVTLKPIIRGPVKPRIPKITSED
jgi:hypothetical protein